MTGEWTTIDKAAWGPGPWTDEPDKIHWIDSATDMDCLMVRHPRSGNWCGYVAVAEGHPAFERHYDDVRLGPCPDDEHWRHEPSCYPDVHGGLTYAAFCAESNDPATGICHVPEPGRPHRVWWFGFDCHHAGDLAPGSEVIERQMAARDPEYARLKARIDAWDRDTYRDAQYVKAEVESLARQLAGLTR